VGDVRVAIRRMLRIPRPRERRVHWAVAGAGASLALIVQLVWQFDWQVFGLVAGIVFGATAAFIAVGRLWTWIALAIGLGAGLGVVPLFGVLGLELSLAVALFISLAGADLGCALAREMARSPAVGITRATYPLRTLFRGALAGAGLAVVVGLIPAIIAAFRGIVVPTCDWWFGITSYIAMPLASAVLAGAIGHAIGAFTGPRRFGPAWLAQVPAVVVAITATWSFYASPPVYTYNAVLGYFPGNMYDENVALSTPLLWSRLEQLLWVIAVIALVASRFDVASYRVRREPRPAGSRGGALSLAFLAAVGALVLRLQGGTLGFAVGAEDLQEALGSKIETEHFIIYYSASPEIERDIQLIAEDHEFRYAQLVEQLGVEPDHKLVSYYFSNKEQKYRLHGSRDVEMAKPWRGEIYLDHREFPHGSLRHEIAHDMAAEFGDPVFGVSSRYLFDVIPLAVPGMIEGLAVAVEGAERGSLHEHARIIQKLDKLPSLDTLFSLSFFSISPTQGYTTAGSFLRFLLDRYGAPKLRELYRSGGNFDHAYSTSRDRLEGEWRTMLSQIQIPDSVVEAQKERFRGVSVFSRPCPHAIAKRQQTAMRRLGQGDRPGAIDLMRQICVDSLFEPRYRLLLGDFLSGDDATGKHEADAVWMQVAIDDRRVTVSVRAQAFRRIARAAALRGELERAAHFLAYARTLPLDLDERRELDAMAFSLAHAGPAGPHLRAYFFPTEKDPTALLSTTAAVAAEPTLGIAHYLLGLQRFNADDYAGAAASLEAALGRGLPGLAFIKNAARRLAVASYRTRDYTRLSLAATVLSGATMNTADRLLAKDWLDRVAFAERRGRR
jgi:hypothetical protein